MVTALRARARAPARRSRSARRMTHPGRCADSQQAWRARRARDLGRAGPGVLDFVQKLGNLAAAGRPRRPALRFETAGAAEHRRHSGPELGAVQRRGSILRPPRVRVAAAGCGASLTNAGSSGFHAIGAMTMRCSGCRIVARCVGAGWELARLGRLNLRRRRPAAGRRVAWTSPRAGGWLVLAGIMVLVAGTLNCISGIAAYARHRSRAT